MSGTCHATSGLRRITRLVPEWKARLVVFVVGLALVVLLLLWIQRSVGSRMAALEQEFGSLSAASFYVGIEMRVRFRQLNERLLEYELNPNADNRRAFIEEAEAFRGWLTNREANLTPTRKHTAREQELFDRVQEAYETYVARAQAWLDPSLPPIEPASFHAIYRELRFRSQGVFDLIEQFVEAQEAAFGGFLQAWQQTLLSLRRLLTLKLVLLLTATVAVAVLVYRAMIATLRQAVIESQAIIERQEKLAALGTLAAGVAHEIRNPLTAIKFRLFSLRRALPAALAEGEDIGVIHAEIDRLDRIVRDFLQFARPAEPALVRVPAERLVQEVRELLQPQLEKADIRLELDAADTTWVQADAQQIKQALINLVQNAAESIGRRGAVTLRVRRESAMLGGRRRPAAVLEVTDTGKGIPPQVQERLFDPFFSTKEGGTGLGLAIAARIVQKHGGLLRYRTALNRGTTFEIVLPRFDDDVGPTPDH